MNLLLLILILTICSIKTLGFHTRTIKKRKNPVVLAMTADPVPSAPQASYSKGLEGMFDDEIKRIAYPALLSCFIEPLAINIESLFVGRLGNSQSLAALGIATSVMRLWFYSWKSITYSATTLIGRNRNNIENRNNRSKNRENYHLLKSTMSQCSLGLGVILTILLQVFSKPILALFNVSPDLNQLLFEETLSYYRIKATAAPAMMYILVNDGISRGNGDTKTPLIAASIGIIIQLLIQSNIKIASTYNLSIIKLTALASLFSSIATALFYSYLNFKKIPIVTNKKEKDDNSNNNSNNNGNNNDNNNTAIKKSIIESNSALFIKNLTLMGFWAYIAPQVTKISNTAAGTHQWLLSMFVINCIGHESLGIAAQVMFAKYPRLRGSTLKKKFLDISRKIGVLESLTMFITSFIIYPKLFIRDQSIINSIRIPSIITILMMIPTSYVIVSEGMLLGIGEFSLLCKNICISVLSSSILVKLVLHSGFTVFNSALGSVWLSITTMFLIRAILVHFNLKNIK